MGPTDNQIERLRSEQAQIGRALGEAIKVLASVIASGGRGIGPEAVDRIIDRMPKP